MYLVKRISKTNRILGYILTVSSKFFDEVSDAELRAMLAKAVRVSCVRSNISWHDMPRINKALFCVDTTLMDWHTSLKEIKTDAALFCKKESMWKGW